MWFGIHSDMDMYLNVNMNLNSFLPMTPFPLN